MSLEACSSSRKQKLFLPVCLSSSVFLHFIAGAWFLSAFGERQPSAEESHLYRAWSVAAPPKVCIAGL